MWTIYAFLVQAASFSCAFFRFRCWCSGAGAGSTDFSLLLLLLFLLLLFVFCSSITYTHTLSFLFFFFHTPSLYPSLALFLSFPPVVVCLQSYAQSYHFHFGWWKRVHVHHSCACACCVYTVQHTLVCQTGKRATERAQIANQSCDEHIAHWVWDFRVHMRVHVSKQAKARNSRSNARSWGCFLAWIYFALPLILI